MGIKPPVTLSFELLAASRCSWFSNTTPALFLESNQYAEQELAELSQKQKISGLNLRKLSHGLA
jgi:hypothetical protein